MKRHPHETTVVGLFKSPEEAHEAIHALEPMNLESQDISYIANQDAYEREEIVSMVAGHKLHEESVHSGKMSGLLGAVLGGLTGISAVVTGGGSLLAAGPLVAVITGAGGVLGGLLGTGFTEAAAEKIDKAVSQGEILVLVHAADRQIAHQARDILKNRGAEEVHLHH